MVQLIEKIKDTSGGFHSWWESDVGIIRKPNSSVNYLDSRTKKERIKDSNIKSETKVAEIKQINTINTMEKTKKVLFFLDASKPINRLIRRAVAIFVFAGIAALIQDFIVGSPEYLIPILTAVLALLDKWIREIKG